MGAKDLAMVEESAIDVLPPQRPPAEAARAMLHAHAQMMDDAYKLAVPMVQTDMVLARFRGKPGDATAAILYGSELGLNPIQSLQRVIPIHGMPSIEARTMVALLKSRGYKVRTTAQSDTSVTVQGIDLDGDVYEATWTIERATLAGYVPTKLANGKWETNNNGKVAGNMKYITDPQAMLKAKAQSEVCRDMAPDVLLGISYTREELESERFEDQPPRTGRDTAASAPVTVDEILHPEAASEPEEKPEPAAEETQASDPKPEPAADDAATDDEQDAQESAAEPVPAPEPAPAPAAELDPHLVRRFHELVFTADISADDLGDQALVLRHITGEPHITLLGELTPEQLAQVVTVLTTWARKKQLVAQITEILNIATLTEEDGNR